MNIPLLFSLLSVLGVFQVWLGKRSGSSTSSSDDYFLMGRKVGLFSLVMTLLATQIGGGALMGAAEEAYKYGWIVLCYPMGMVLGMALLGLGFGAKFRKMQLSTVAEVFEKVYGSVPLRKFASILSIVSLFFILVAQAIAAKKFFLSLGFSTPWLFIALWMTLVFYTAFGGLKAVIQTDILQAGFILAAFLIAFLGKTPNLPEVSASFSSSAPWLTWMFMPLFFMLIEQDMGQRCFAAKSPRTVTYAALIAAGVLFFVSLFPIYFGQLARSLSILPGESVLMTSIAAFTSPTVFTILIAAILMAIVSTADSLLCSISSNIACDFFQKRESLSLCRWLTFAVGASTLLLSFCFDNVVSMLMFSYQLSVSILFVPIIMALIWKKPSKKIAYTAMIIGAMAFFSKFLLT
ncbi:MAG: sodium:solute symporter [Chlamydiales bacterium]